MPRVIKSNGPVALIPVDLVVRELDSKLVVASALAGQGLTVVVGHKAEISHIAINSGPLVWHGKELFSPDSSSTKNTTADRLAQNGSAIVYSQDEGGMFQVAAWRENVIFKHQLDAMRDKKISRIAAWGSRQGEVIAEYAPELAGSVRVTGSARFDICAPRFDWIDHARTQAIEGRYGPYILMCTRFGSVAHADGFDYWFRQRVTRRKKGGPDNAEVWLAKWRQDMHDFAEFIVLIRDLARNHPDKMIVLRPHPSEDLEFYRLACAQLQNVEVVREGNVLQWIRGAALVVHSNCTTGIEAVLAGKPVLNFLPGDRQQSSMDVEVAREAGAPATSLSEAIELAEELLSGRHVAPGWSPHAISILNNLQSEALPLLVAETLAAAREHRIGETKLSLPVKTVRQRIRESLNRPVLSRKPAKGVYETKRSPFDIDHIEGILDGCRNHGVGSGRVRHFTPYYVVVDPS